MTSGASAEDKFAAADLEDALRERGIKPATPPRGVVVRLLRSKAEGAGHVLTAEHVELTPEMHDEGYAIVPCTGGLCVVADTATGIFYGSQTVKQLIRGGGAQATLQQAVILDWPAMKYRGLHDDLSRGPVPTLEFQMQQIRTLAAYKVNLYSPYFENTFAYAQNPLPGLPGGAMTAAEARELVEYASHYHVMIVPEQEAFGHLHSVLIWEQYQQLSETPQGAVLAPGEGDSLKLIHQWFAELAAAFPGKMLHIGADETFDLGKGKTGPDVDSRGLGSVYVEFLTRIHSELAPLDRRLLFWGDVAMNEPALVKTLPKDMIAVAWYYDPQEKGFERWIKPFRDADMETWVAPGVNNWNRVYPNNDKALHNIQGFVADGQKYGATGVMNTVWNDDGEGLFLEDWYGVLFGAAASWQPGSSDIAAYQNAYGPTFHGDEQGLLNSAQKELIAAHQVLAGAGLNDGQDSLFWEDPWSADGQAVSAKLLPVAHDLRLHAEAALAMIAKARDNPTIRQRDALDAMDLGARRLDFIGLKFQSANLIATTYRHLYDTQTDSTAKKEIARELWNITGVNGRCQDMRNGYSYLKEEYRDTWLRENRPYWLGNVLARYDEATELWIRRGERFEAVRHQWGSQHLLPAPESLGLPPVTKQ